MRFTPAFYRFAAVCSFISAITTLGLIFLPGMLTPAEDFAGRMARVNDPLYQLYAWVYFVHPFLVVAAALGVAMRLRREATSLVIPGLVAFLLWGATEAGQQALTLFAFNPWRLAWLAGDPVVRATMEVRTAMYDGVWNAMYFLLIVGFFFANVLYAVALWRRRGLSRVVGALYAAAAALTLQIIIVELGGGQLLPEAIDFWVYPLIQPLARTLIGVWLWTHRNENEASGPALGIEPRRLPRPGPPPAVQNTLASAASDGHQLLRVSIVFATLNHLCRPNRSS